MPRVAGCDPGTSSLDIAVLDDGIVADQVRFAADTLRADPVAPVRWLESRGPFDLVAGPSGYGLPLIHRADCTANDLTLMSLVRPDERGSLHGVGGFSAMLRAFVASTLPVVFLPGVIHLPTVPPHRKWNRIDMGTADKLAVVALAIAQSDIDSSFCLVELGSAFTACIAVERGRVVDGIGGTSGPIGWQSGGAWDGELAYLLSPLGKGDLFAGGAGSIADVSAREEGFAEAARKAIASMKAVATFDEVIVSGRLLEIEPEVARLVGGTALESLPGAWVKGAAQGAAVVADGLAGGRWASILERMRLREANGNVLDHIVGEHGERVRAMFGG